MRVGWHVIEMNDEYPLADTTAARMLSEALARAKQERGISIRQIGKQMGYKTAVVLSHMALGRAPVPIDRAEELADTLLMDKGNFLQAVVRQRHPDVAWHLLAEDGRSSASDGLAHELEAVLGCRLKDLSDEQRAIMREVAAEPRPRRRWLSVHELHAVEVLRAAVPSMQTEGVSSADLAGIQALLEND
ncbi:hypothetical protein BPTFM16_01836 [Altererythrobacter insulae]|nr:hypothetical protein BPTFM16_01836 [Altererythrobacter insulae]